MWWGAAKIRFEVRVCPAVEQPLHDHEMSLSRSYVQWSPVVLHFEVGIYVGATCNQQLRNLDMSPQHRRMQWRTVVATPMIYVLRVLGYQPFHKTTESTLCGKV